MLVVAAVLNFAVAVLHVGIILGGGPAYRYFGAGESFAQAADSGRAWPAVATAGLVVGFAGFGAYALSGAGLIGPLPLLRWMLIGIAALYTLRGLAVFPQALGLIVGTRRDVVFSAVSLAVGLVHAAGVWLAWPLPAGM